MKNDVWKKRGETVEERLDRVYSENNWSKAQSELSTSQKNHLLPHVIQGDDEDGLYRMGPLRVCGICGFQDVRADASRISGNTP